MATACLTLSATLYPPDAAALQVYVVNTTDDIADKQGCTPSHCSLREAIVAANKNKGQEDYIHFSIAGDVTHTIRPASALPAITDPAVIDGTTEPGFAISGRPVVELDGSLAPPSAVGLRVSGGSSTVRGLIINRFGSTGSSTGGASGIVLESKGNNLVTGNYIGTDPTGHSARGNRLAGIVIYRSSSNVIGGTTPGSANVLSGNGTGVGITSASGNRVVGNYIGVDAEGDNHLGNESGVHIGEATNNVIGGRADGEANVISANAGAGVAITGKASQGNRIEGNAIGTDLNGTADFGNFWGVRVGSGAISNVIGGDQEGAGNTIAFNRHSGVLIIDDNVAPRALRISVWGNSIHSNGIPPFAGLGIELSPEGVNPNDPLDRDLGANRKMNYPVLTSAVGSLTTDVTGTLNSEPDRTYRIEVFANPTCDPSGYGEGKQYLGAVETSTDASGNAEFSLTSSASTPPGWFVTATSTETQFRNGSEFGKCLEVDEPPDPTSWVVNQVADEVDAHGCTVSHCTLREAMLRSNSVPGRDTITFAIPAEVDVAPHVISPLSALPVVTEATLIDGTTEPDYAGAPVVRVDGGSPGAGAYGLQLRVGASELRGLSITRWTGAEVYLESDGNVLVANWLGVSPEGTPAGGPGAGLLIESASNRIGEASPQSINRIRDHESWQIVIRGGDADNNEVIGNYIGAEPGETDFSDSLGGIRVEDGADGNVLGVPEPNGGNMMLTRAFFAFRLEDVSNTVIQNNIVDRATQGGSDTVWIEGGSGTLVGGRGPLEGNVVRDSQISVAVAEGSGHTIVGNDLFAGERSIDLGRHLTTNFDTGDGVTRNDPLDVDDGPNGLQNFPVLVSAVRRGSVVEVAGTLNSHRTTEYRIDLYATYRGVGDQCEGGSQQIDGVDYRFGMLDDWVGASPDTEMTNDSGNLAFTFDTLPDAVGTGAGGNAWILATATGPEGTSEGSACVLVTDEPASFVEADGTELTLNGEPYRFTGINIYNANSDGWCGYEMRSPGRFGQALDDLGPGHEVVRAWFFQALALDGTGSARDWAAFDNTIAAARGRGIRLIVTLSDHWGECGSRAPGNGTKSPDWYRTGYTQTDPGMLTSYRDFAAEVVTRYRDEPTIAMWQLMNEAETKDLTTHACEPNGDLVLRDFAADVSAMIKAIDPNHLISLGTMGGPQCGPHREGYRTVHDVATIDVCEFHDYFPTEAMPTWIYEDGYDNGLMTRIEICHDLGKPIFIGEAGIPRDTGLDARAEMFVQKMDAQFAAGIVGFLAWNYAEAGEILDHTYDIRAGDPSLPALAGPS